MANLFQRDGIWYITYMHNGRQYRKSTRTKSRKLAEIAFKDLELKIFSGKMKGSRKNPGANISIKEIFRRYLMFVEDNSVPEYFRHVRYYLKRWEDYLYDQKIYKLEDIDLKLVDDFLIDVLNGNSVKTKKEYLASLKACLNRAVKWGILEKNPINEAHITARTPQKVNFFSTEQIAQIMKISSEELQPAIGLLVNTGIRLGELWALRWEDVDFVNRQILVRSYNGFTPKGKRDRNIPLNKEGLRILRRLDRDREDDAVFVYRLAKSDRALSVQFKYRLNRLGLEGRLHDLRHTFASHLVMGGTPLPVVKELLGHADISTTMVYSHVSPSIHKREVARLDFSSV
jgi:integrase